MHILIIEDNPGDARLMQEALRAGSAPITITVFADGERALEWLRSEAAGSEAKQPDLILLDLHLPGKDGQEVLVELKGDPALRGIPVIVFSGRILTESDQQLLTGSAECVVTKPMNLDAYMALIHEITRWWATQKSER